MLNGYEKLNIPIAIQIFGANPETMAKAAKEVTKKFKNVIIDINMGCPVPKVALSSKAGSGLLKEPELVKKIVSEVVNNVKVPVTVKIRSGWDLNNVNGVEIARIIEEAGAAAITIHGRTRSQGYSGNVDLDIIKKVKQAVKIPVIGNGDIKSKEDAKKMLEYTGCDAIMIGRAALGNPWIIKETVEYLDNNKEVKKPTIEEKKEMIKKHFNYLLEIKPASVALLEMRTNSAYYLKGIPNTAQIKQEIFKTKTKEEFLEEIDKIKV